MKAAFITYAIISTNDLDKIDFKQVGETSKDTIRKSIDQTQFVIKYNTIPTFIESGEVLPVSILTHAQCVELMGTDAWSEDIEDTEDIEE